MSTATRAASFFLAEDEQASIAPYGSGNVNDTYIIASPSGPKKILQRLNPDVFPDPPMVMRNMSTVLDHLHRERENDTPFSSRFIFITIYPGKTGYYFQDTDGSTWRLMSMVDNCRTRSSITKSIQAEELGRGLAVFHRLLSTLDVTKLEDTLPGFHDTPAYLARYDCTQNDPVYLQNRLSAYCASFIEQRRSLVHCLEDERDKLGCSIIHGDPKVANFLFDKNDDTVISLIDLDTVKPGLLLHDLGDALRSCCNPAGEKAEQEDAVYFDHDLFRSWLEGYLAEAGHLLTERDRANIVNAALLISFELGLRFFTDFLEGNRYFKVDDPAQNLYRALNQFTLVASIEEQTERLNTIVNNLMKKQQTSPDSRLLKP